MSKNVQARRTSLWRRKITAVVCLPIVIYLWIIGWTLTQIGFQGRPTEIKQKIILSNPEFEAHEKSKISKDDKSSEIAYKPEIIV